QRVSVSSPATTPFPPTNPLRNPTSLLASDPMSPLRELLAPADTFARRHTGNTAAETAALLDTLGYASVDALVDAAVPAPIRRGPLDLPEAVSESTALAELREIASRNQIFRHVIGLGYSDTHTPPVIQRNILENPAWYTAY